jgi:hypothetical protein
MHDASGSNCEWAIRVFAATLCLAVHGCDSVHGGAVELSWKLRPASSGQLAKFVDCDSGLPGTGPVAQIRLHWQAADSDAPGSSGSQAWSCDDNQGVTRFDVPIGTANLWITPECNSDSAGGVAALDTYITPAPVQRDVSLGDTVSLGAVELVVNVSNCEFDTSVPASVPRQPCICCVAGQHCTPPSDQ